MNCGPEIGVAATKSFTAQLILLYKIVQKLGENITIGFEEFSISISKMLENTNKIQEIAKELKEVSDIYILGRGINYPIAIESALKLKELTYIHAEGNSRWRIKTWSTCINGYRCFCYCNQSK